MPELDVANIFWVGGTGANVAMAFARLQYLGLIPRDRGIRHFLIDTPDNLYAPDNLTPKNIALTTFKLLDKDLPVALPLTHSSYTSFDEFLNAYKHLKPFFEGIPDEDEAKILNTPVKDGNYYIPALAATMAASELKVPDRGLHQRSIICGSCFGGTGSGVAPALARQLLVHGNRQVELVYLNDWLVNNKDEDGKRRRNPNQVANLKYLEQLCETMRRKRGVNYLSYYVMRVSDDGTQIAPPWTHSNTDTEIPNPFPYYTAMFIQSLLIPARGQLLPESGVWTIQLHRHALADNPTFAYAYAYNRLFPSLGRQRGFSFVLGLVDGKSGKDWGLARLHWSRKFLTQIRDLESDEPAKRESARAAIVEKECREFDFQSLGWPGFVKKPGDMPAVDTLMLSYPSLFSAAFYFQEHVRKKAELRDAYLALVALVATRQVYSVRDQWLAEYHYQDELNAQPIVLRDSRGTTVGYGGPPGLYLWPAFPSHAMLRELLDNDPVLQEALFHLHEENENQSIWKSDTILGWALNDWSHENRYERSQGTPRMPFVSRRFFEEAKGTEAAKGTVERLLPANAQAIAVTLMEEHLNLELEYHEDNQRQQCSIWIACDDYHLGVSGQRILQWVNLGGTPVTKDQALDHLVLDYRTVIQVEKAGYKVEVVDSGDHDGAGTLGREAYLALIALVATKRVYAEVGDSAANNVDVPITLRTGNREIVGDTAPQGEYVRPRVEVYGVLSPKPRKF